MSMYDWSISEYPAQEGHDPDGRPFPPRNHRLVRIERMLLNGMYESIEVPIRMATPVDQELRMALKELE